MRYTAGLVLTVILAASATGQQPIPVLPVAEMIPSDIDSGSLGNPADTSAVVYRDLVTVPDGSSLRLHFDDAELPAGSFIRVMSLLDAQVQELDAATLGLWDYSSAYFNGGTVCLELVAAPHTEGNRIVVGTLETEPVGGGVAGGPGECGICGSDDRVPSNEQWVARLIWNGGQCTAAVFNRGSCVVTAGHCLEVGATDQVLEFNVPDSQPNCGVVHPPVADQFPVVFEDWQVGSVDWGVAMPGQNNLGELPYDRYGEFRPISQTPATMFTQASLTGYGADTDCTRNRTQQVDTGPINFVGTSTYGFSIDLTVFSSGSPLLVDGEIVAIAVACPCPNIGTRVDVPAFAASRYANCPSCGDPGAGSCFLANGTPFCEDQACCLQICDVDPACCDTAWDEPCAELAISLCDGTLENDDCETATPIGHGDTVFTTVGATTGGPALPAACDEGNGLTVVADTWYLYDPDCPGTLTVSTCDQADFDTRLAAYTGTCNALTLVACSDDDAGCTGGTSSMDVPITCGVPVLIRVGGVSGNGSGTLSLTCDVADACPPDNNVCDLAFPIDEDGTVFDTTFATTDGPLTTACVFGNVHKDLWYAYVADCQGTVTVDLCGSGFDTRLAVYAAACPDGPGEAIACDDNFSCDDTSLVSFPATAGSTYMIRVGGIAGASGTGQISIENTGCADPPSNDNCGSSSPAAVGTIPFTTIGASTDGPDESCDVDQVHQDVWYRYLNNCDGPVTLSLCGADYDARLAVYGALCPSSPDTAIACSDDVCGAAPHLTFDATPSTIYRIRVGGAFGSTGSGDLVISCGATGPPCPGDTDGDGEVDVNDLNNVILDWGTDGSAHGGDLTGPLPGSPPDGIVNVNDLNAVIVNWGVCE